jgi:predicted nucleic acid-binding Zn ribbon protein
MKQQELRQAFVQGNARGALAFIEEAEALPLLLELCAEQTQSERRQARKKVVVWWLTRILVVLVSLVLLFACFLGVLPVWSDRASWGQGVNTTYSPLWAQVRNEVLGRVKARFHPSAFPALVELLVLLEGSRHPDEYALLIELRAVVVRELPRLSVETLLSLSPQAWECLCEPVRERIKHGTLVPVDRVIAPLLALERLRSSRLLHEAQRLASNDPDERVREVAADYLKVM